MQNQINTNPISQFVQLLKAAELSQSKEVKMPIAQARLLSSALNDILLKINQDYENLYQTLRQNQGQEPVSVSMDGGGFGQEK